MSSFQCFPSDIAAMRVNYTQAELFESDVVYDPMHQFERWLNDALRTPGIGEANAMTLATSTAEGGPNARIVLLKGFDNQGFVFYVSRWRETKNTIEEKDQPENL